MKYYETRDAQKVVHFKQVVSLLRKKADLYHRKEADLGLNIQKELREIDENLKVEQAPPHKLNLRKAIEIARRHPGLSDYGNARFSGWYQGAYWLVQLHRGDRHLGRVTVDDETGTVLDIKLGNRRK